ncbi:MAG: inactive transglutaminase family protein [Myxococcota bacterium]|nr:inactive transglutaminase family protein [Myxococcota bacterium]
MSARLQLAIAVVVLTGLGLGLTLYKHFALGFPLLPGRVAEVWTAEARITFDAEGKDQDIELSLAIPQSSSSLRVLNQYTASMGYDFEYRMEDGQPRGVWTGKDKSGKQVIYYQVVAFEGKGPKRTPDTTPPSGVSPANFEPAYRKAADALIEKVRAKVQGAVPFASQIILELAASNPNDDVRMLLGISSDANSRARLAVDLINLSGTPARIARGIALEDGRRREKLSDAVEVWTGERWQDFQPDTGTIGLPPRFLLWQRGGESLLDLVGGHGSHVTFSTLSEIRGTRGLVVLKGEEEKAPLVDFSIYTLPINEQNIFKLLLLVPIGALVVVLMRCVVGVRTSGTFMPILIALAFKQTELLSGLVMFVVVVAIGLVIRTYLSRLNLLLVPRISAVVIVVILLFAGVSIASYKLGIEAGLNVTFFPMIIMAWTIERMSVLWEEEGAREALIQGTGSLAVAVLVYLAMSIPLVEYLTFSFPELLLVVLAATLLLGHYTGYRLTELRRFAPMVHDS